MQDGASDEEHGPGTPLCAARRERGGSAPGSGHWAQDRERWERGSDEAGGPVLAAERREHLGARGPPLVVLLA